MAEFFDVSLRLMPRMSGFELLKVDGFELKLDRAAKKEVWDWRKVGTLK
jgi:hypothetical protein